MSGGARRAIGIAAILAGLLAWIVIAATIGSLLTTAPWWAQLAYFVVAGTAWVLPLRPVFAWMGRS